MVRSKVIKGPKDRHGKKRKYIQVPDNYYNDFQFGDIVEFDKIEETKQES